MHKPVRWVLAVLALGACGGSDSGASRDIPNELEDTFDENRDAIDVVDQLDVSPTDLPNDGREVADTPMCLAPYPAVAGTDQLLADLGSASVTIDGREGCARSYQITSTATRRDDFPASPRSVVEQDGDPRLRSGHDLFDALHALALAEMHENEVASISDGAFSGGAAIPCGTDGCFETGRKWTYVWTRDTAFAVDLGLAALAPERAADSLRFKLSPRRDGMLGGEPGDDPNESPLHIVQDTGSGGSYPVSSDRVVWALGARAVLSSLTGDRRTMFRDDAFEALVTTLEHDRSVVFDASTGLYRGETSFLDWREQSYPNWTQHDVVDIAMSAALGTNVLHLEALTLAADLATELEGSRSAAFATELGDARASRYRGFAADLRGAIHRHFWLDDVGLFASFLPTTLDPAPVRRFDLLGESLAILSGVASDDEARRILSTYPHYGPGAPVIWPQQQSVAIYHNRAEWPFVDAYWLRAARKAKHDAVTDRMVHALMRGAALNLSNMESFEAATGAPWLEDDTASGPVVNSQRQLWSVAGYLAMVHGTLFGLAATPTGLAPGLEVTPWLTRGLRTGLFAGSDRLVLEDYPHRGRKVTIVIALPADVATGPNGGAYRVSALAVDGAARPAGETVVPDARLGPIGAHARVDVTLAIDPAVPASTLTEVTPAQASADWQTIYAPRTPQVKSVTAEAGKLRLELGLGAEKPDGLTLDVYRDGVRVAADLPGTSTSWVDPDSDATAARSPCYTVAAVFTASGNESHHARAACWWGADSEAIQSFDARTFEAVGGNAVDDYGRFHYQGWGDAGHTLTLRGVRPTRSGPQLVQLEYGNGAGPINTGIACGVKRVTVIDEASASTVADGIIVMPQLGRWDRWALSSFVAATLMATSTYRIVISSDAGTMNMSALAHFATYRGATGGIDGPFTRVNIAALKLLAR